MADYDLIIDGKRVPAETSFSVVNPADETSAGECPIASREQLDAAVAAAAKAFETWSHTSDEEREAACGRLVGVLNDNAEELAQLLTKEQGKPLNGAGSRFELGGAAAWAGYSGSLSLPEKIIQDDAIICQPLWRAIFSATTKQVKGYQVHPTQYHQFQNVWMG